MRARSGKDDMRKHGPFNVDRAPTGQLVPKGSIKNPIDRYPDSKPKLQRGKGRESNENEEEEEDEEWN